MTRHAVQHEKIEQAAIVTLLRSLGAQLYVLGTRRSRGKNCPGCGVFVPFDQGTRQTEGIADLFAFLKTTETFRQRYNADALHAQRRTLRRRLLVVEAKRRKTATTRAGKPSLAQVDFLMLCEDALIDTICGDLDTVIAWLTAEQYLVS